ncbi:hypothetical protein LTR27_003297 [Elasticomyces elasticus]|nr:hypothetical protein LTR27_003297 [Elasticomyces elasticus]
MSLKRPAIDTAPIAPPAIKRHTMRQKMDAMTPEDCAAERLKLEEVLKDIEALPESDERQEIIDELESGTHELLLERNGATNTKCRADICVV